MAHHGTEKHRLHFHIVCFYVNLVFMKHPSFLRFCQVTSQLQKGCSSKLCPSGCRPPWPSCPPCATQGFRRRCFRDLAAPPRVVPHWCQWLPGCSCWALMLQLQLKQCQKKQKAIRTWDKMAQDTKHISINFSSRASNIEIQLFHFAKRTLHMSSPIWASDPSEI